MIARAFELGADDYIVKPFSPTELVARIQAALWRRAAPERVEPLAELAVNAGRVVTHEDLLHRVWGPTRPGSAQVIRTQLMRLRQKLGEDSENPTYIFAEPRVGYRMAEGERTYG